MADIYDIIVQGIKDAEGLSDVGLTARLKQLQPSVRALRSAYRNYPVWVPYEKTDIQAAYLLTYFPHYYQLIYKVLIEDYPSIFLDKYRVKLVYFGGGPGPEIYGTIKYIVNNRLEVTTVDVLLFDINALQWKYSHDILQNHLLPDFVKPGLQVNFSFNYCDLTKALDENLYKNYLTGCNLLVFQNCLNEIPIAFTGRLKENVQMIFKLLPEGGSLLLSDLTGGTPAVTSLMQNIESQLNSFYKGQVRVLHSIVEHYSSETIQSVHHIPSSLIRQFLLDGQDGLIPRKWLKYNYCFLLKSDITPKAEIEIENGLQAIYTPLNFVNGDANNYLNEKSFVGIDFGTSTTVVSLAKVVDGGIKTEAISIIQKDEHGHSCFRPLIHSAIALKDSRLLFGCHAYELKSDLGKNINIWHSFKMELGAANNVQYSDSVLYDNLDYPINNTHDAITLYFKYIKSQVENHIKEHFLPGKIEYAVSIPASFLESERMDLLRCLEDAGIVVGSNPFIDEPIAAVLNYLFESTDTGFLDEPKKIMVIDCGAGTCDVSILEIGKKANGAYSKNLSISRFGKIGGKLLDCMIADQVLWKQLASQHSNILSCSKAEKEFILESLTEIGEKLKIKLCRSLYVESSNNYQLPGTAKSSDMTWIIDEDVNLKDGTQLNFAKPAISYEQFNGIMKQYTAFYLSDHIPVNTVNYSIQSALEKSGLLKSGISEVLLTGGGARNPYLISLIADFFSDSVIIIPDNIQEHVSKGAAIHSLALNTFGVNLIKPILSDDLYIRNHAGSLLLFPAGTEIPSNDRRIEVNTLISDQDFIEIPVFNASIAEPLKVISFPCKSGTRYLLHFFINPEKWLDCEVTENGVEIDYEVIFPSVTDQSYPFNISEGNFQG
jgi:molecular chaperone DnaK (HSP70)